MKLSAVAAAALGATANAHTIFQRVSVNGADQGQLVGVRAPAVNTPVQDVTSNSIACNTGTSSSSSVIEIAPGDTVGAWWQHVLGGPQGANDKDNPIASSHKGPFMVYLAKVDDAATAGTTGLDWFKIVEDTVDSSGKWGVDRMIAGDGWSYFDMPECIAPGEYLMRAELIALHSAYTVGGAQFYMSCANVKITGSGTLASPETVSFPGAYKATDPGIQINIYDTQGNPTNGGKAYTAPGPAPITC